MTTAIIIDDHPLARMAIRGVLETHAITVTHEFEDGTAALKALRRESPDIIVIDVDIPGVNGIDLIEALRKQHFPGIVIVVSAKNDRYYSRRSAEAGAHAFISKKQEMTTIMAAIQAAQNGYSYFPFVLDDFTGVPPGDREKLELLSTQEMKVMRYMLEGFDNNKIGEQMHISGKTVSTYKTRLMEKLGCKTLIELLAFASQNKLI
jgi:two-component system, NarL family, response regulator EvgA